MESSPWAPPEQTPEPAPARTKEDDDDVVPLLDIWFRPAPTMRFLLRRGSLTGALVIAALHGVVSADTEGLPAGADVLARVVVGPIGGVLSIAMLALITWALGRVFEGRGSFADCLMALAWGGLPSTVAYAAVLGFTITVGLAGMDPSVYLLLGLVVLASGAWLWGLVWQVVTVAEAHRFGWFEAGVTVVLPYIAVVGCFGMMFAAVFGMA